MQIVAKDRNLAISKLNEAIARGKERAPGVIRNVFENVPKDAIVKANALQFGARETGALTIGVQGFYPVHTHALGQICEKANVPEKYIGELLAPTVVGRGRAAVPAPEWRRNLATQILSTHYSNSNARHLVRIASGEVRGFLSDQFRRLDSRPLLDAFFTKTTELGAIPYDGSAGSVRVSLKMIVPDIVEPVPGEFGCIGLEFSNSDFGAGTMSVRVFFLRLWCLNGATAEDVMRQVHLGKRLTDDIEYSRRTLRLDTDATVSALSDTIGAALLLEKRAELFGRIKDANETEISWEQLKAKLAKQLTKEELKRTEDAFTGPDTINLPPVQSMWRASNALSWIAQTVETDDRRHELERLAGSFIAAKAA